MNAGVRTSPLLTDLYQFTMAYAYWRSGKHEEEAVFEYFFRKCPFGGEFAITAGLADFLRFLKEFRFSGDDIAYLCTIMPVEQEFYDWLAGVNAAAIRVYAAFEGSAVFPRVPILRVEGPLAICQLLETNLLYTMNFPSLVATNAARYRLAAGPKAALLEFGLRRAQDGMRASEYAWIGGFDGTSNVLAARLFDIPVRGTMAHSFVSSFSSLNDLKTFGLTDTSGVDRDFVQAVTFHRAKLNFKDTNEGEFAAFIAYAQAFPSKFLALVDTYDTLKSGVPNFIAVASALADFGYRPAGIRIDSGDLAYLSREARRMFEEADEVSERSGLATCAIAVSNDINEEVLRSLNRQGHEINIFGIGTHLVTCQGQPAFGGVYKLVALAGRSTMKLSNEPEKITIPGAKDAYRLIGRDGKAILDLMTLAGAPAPKAGERVLCRHPFAEAKRTYVVPSEVVPLLEPVVWDGERVMPFPSRSEIRAHVASEIAELREDHLRDHEPTPYKVALSPELYDFLHGLWQREAPIGELR
ncbi:MAG: nicotinate phosphoribosyltransferase [bacterium]|nr:nicotinate phosphoribosyltransferase [bacterium]